MRVFQNLFDYGDTGIVAMSTCNSSYGTVPAAEFGQAVLWKDGKSTNLFDLCTRPVPLAAQKDAIAALRGKLARAVETVHKKLDWMEARLSEDFRELPAHARQLGDNLLLMGFVGAIKPGSWRLVDVAQGRVVWEGDSSLVEDATSAANAKWGHLPFLMESQLPLASGADFVEIQFGMTRVIFVLDGERLVPAEWSLKHQNYADNHGLRSGMLSQIDGQQNAYALIDPRTGKTMKTFPAPSRSKNGSRPATTPGSDRIAVSHNGGTVDIVDGLGDTHFSIRPFPQLARTEQLGVRLSNDGEWLGADGWHVFRVVNLEKREVAELAVPEPNMSDAPDRVLYDRNVLVTGNGVALMDESGLTVIPYSDLQWQPVTQPGRRTPSKALGVYRQHLERWRRPALTLKLVKKGDSWLYGSPDLPICEVPQHEGRPMQLLARIALEDAAAMLSDDPWPKDGALYFFTAVDAEGAPLQDELFNLSATRVLWWHGTGIPEVTAGHELAPKQPLKLALHKADLPDIGAAIVEATMLDDIESEAYRAWLERQRWADQPAGHRLGGYPTILQRNDLEAQAAHFADQAHYPPRDIVETSAVARWRLLLQLDSDDVCMWGTDSGMLYFLVHDDDLARRDFSRVVSICEGL